MPDFKSQIDDIKYRLGEMVNSTPLIAPMRYMTSMGDEINQGVDQIKRGIKPLVPAQQPVPQRPVQPPVQQSPAAHPDDMEILRAVLKYYMNKLGFYNSSTGQDIPAPPQRKSKK